MLCYKFGWSGSLENSKCHQRIFLIIFLGIGHDFHLNNLVLSLLMNSSCQVWLKLAQRFWRMRFLEFRCCQYICVISLLYPIEKGQTFHLNKRNLPSPIAKYAARCQIWLKLIRFLQFKHTWGLIILRLQQFCIHSDSKTSIWIQLIFSLLGKYIEKVHFCWVWYSVSLMMSLYVRNLTF